MVKKLLLTACVPVLMVAYTNCSGFVAGGLNHDVASLESSIEDIVGLRPIASNFNIDEYIQGSLGAFSGKDCGPGADGSAGAERVGAFRFQCSPSHNGYNDPIVYPGQPGASHLHTFFGNTKTDAFSTYESLRTTGEGSCHGGPLNRSAYWIPSMMNGRGKVVMPESITIYYKALPKNDPECKSMAPGGCVGLPRGLRMIFGYDFSKAYDDPTQMHTHYSCENGSSRPDGKNEFDNIADAQCAVGNRVGGGVSTPPCWDGINLDSPNHRSHLAYGGFGNTGVYRCPATHPYTIPVFSLKAWYAHDGPADIANWYLSSDRMPGHPQFKGGATFHSDWFGAWDDDVMKEWWDHAINRGQNCSDGWLGNGRGLKRADATGWKPVDRLVDPPAMSPMELVRHKNAMANMHKTMNHSHTDHH